VRISVEIVDVFLLRIDFCSIHLQPGLINVSESVREVKPAAKVQVNKPHCIVFDLRSL
jgi:hypothetical protein